MSIGCNGEQIDIEDALAALVDDPDFQVVVRSRSSFNLFEAVGAVRAELRHSDFLAFLLSPARNHGLGSLALVRVLRAVLAKLPPADRPVTVLDLIIGDVDDAIVDRELHDIDILIELKRLNLVVVIENKIDAKAGDGQLTRYREVVQRRYPTHRHLLVFLTPRGAPPDDDAYVPFGYAEVARVLDATVDAAPPETALAVRHYVEMLRRHIVPDDNLRDLARRLYERHREAFDFVYDCKPQAPGMIGIVRDMYEAEAPGLVKDGDTLSMLRFVPEGWATVPELNACAPGEWTKSGRSLLFEVKTYNQEPYASRVNVALIVGPAPQAIRAKLYEGARDRPSVFVGLVKPMGAKWATIFARELLGAAAGKDLSHEDRAVAVNAAWADFLATSLPALKQAVADILST